MYKKLMMMLTLATAAVAQSPDSSYIKGCSVHDDVIQAIAEVERHPAKKRWYPYLISVNEKSDQKTLKKAFEGFWIDGRTIDCRDKRMCARFTSILAKNGMTNLDLGPMQINPTWHKMDTKKYFDVTASYRFACGYLATLSQRLGKWEWKTVASYHSMTPGYNEAYKKKLLAAYAKIAAGSGKDENVQR